MFYSTSPKGEGFYFLLKISSLSSINKYFEAANFNSQDNVFLEEKIIIFFPTAFNLLIKYSNNIHFYTWFITHNLITAKNLLKVFYNLL